MCIKTSMSVLPVTGGSRLKTPNVEQPTISNLKKRRTVVAQSLRLTGGLANREIEPFSDNTECHFQNIQKALVHVTTLLLSLPQNTCDSFYLRIHVTWNQSSL